jgi:hypothetical protein
VNELNTKLGLASKNVQLSVLLCVFGVFCGASGEAVAGFTVATGDVIKFGNGPGADGEFVIQKANDNSSPNDYYNGGNNAAMNSFRTFCVQTSEYMNFANTGATFKVLGISNSSVGVKAHALTGATAALYREFLNGREAFNRGILTDGRYAMFGDLNAIYKFSSSVNDSHLGNVKSANALQTLIWKYQDQNFGLLGGENNLSNRYKTALLNYAAGVGGINNLSTGSIKIMNLAWETPVGYRGIGAQDQLIDTAMFNSPAPPPSAVPEPTSLCIFGLGAIGFAIRRRRSQS